MTSVPEPDLTGVQPSTGQMRGAETLVLLHQHRLRHVFNTPTGWHYWDGQRWRPDDSNHARECLLGTIAHMSKLSLAGHIPATTIAEMHRSSGQRGVMEIASHMSPFAVSNSDMDSNPYLLNTANGTLDLRSFDLRPHDPGDLITQVTKAAYNPEEKSQLWDSFLTTVLPDAEVRDYLQRLIGYSLLGEVTHHVFPLLIGEGGNGKGTFYGAILDALGDYAAPFDSTLLLQTRSDFASANAPAPAVLGLKGKRFVVTSETPEDAKLATAKMKFFTGGDTLTARGLHAKANTVFEPSHTMFMVSNFEPRLSSEDAAAWQRIVAIPFNVKIRGTDLEIPGFDHQLRSAKDAILTWAVEGLRAFYDRGLDAPSQVLLRTAAYHAKTDGVAQYIDARLQPASGPLAAKAKLPRTEIWEDFLRYAKAENIETPRQSDFYAKVAKTYDMSKTNGVWVFRGVEISSDVFDTSDETFLDNLTNTTKE